MPRYKLTLEYNGGPYYGWQRQTDRISVQERMEQAVESLTGVPSPVQGSGRTDAGVHALGQVAHVDIERDWEPRRLMEALNHKLRPDPVVVLCAEKAADDFHARFAAVEREYVYRIINRRAPLTCDRGLAWQIRQDLDADAMAEGATYLLGHHDFTTFRSSMCQAKSPCKTVDAIDIAREGDLVTVTVRARSFLHNQVRSFVGTLVRVGSGSWAPERVGAALAARNRVACGPVAPPDGLYLVRVTYPDAGAEDKAEAAAKGAEDNEAEAQKD